MPYAPHCLEIPEKPDACTYITLHAIDENGCIRFGKVQAETGLGESLTETLIRRLRASGMVSSDGGYLALTDAGSAYMDALPIRMVDVSDRIFVIGEHQQATLVRGRGHMITDGAEQRDCGTRHGSEGASVFVIRDGRFMIPQLWNLDDMDPDFAGAARAAGMGEGDALVVAGSRDKNVSRYSSVSIALELV